MLARLLSWLAVLARSDAAKDVFWQATVVADRLLVRGEIEASNVDRFDVVVPPP
jgi:hypothetical protein